MVKEDYVSFELAKLLKEKGFDGECLSWYSTKGNLYNYADCFEIDLDGITELCSAPTLQMVMKWLREVHHIFIYIEPFITTSGLQGYNPYCTKIGEEFMWVNPLNTSSDTYEEAVEATIKYCLVCLI